MKIWCHQNVGRQNLLQERMADLETEAVELEQTAKDPLGRVSLEGMA